MNRHNKRLTMRDIASQAGVSAQTVSRVVNNREGVSDKVRERIKHIIDEMDYQPNQAAQVLKSQRTHLIEAILVDIGYMGEIGDTLSEIADAAKERHYDVLFSSIQQDELEDTLKKSVSRMVEGFILLAPRLSISDADMLAYSQGIPFVRMGNLLGTSLPSVTYDFRYGTDLAIEHLIDLGHRHIAEISGPLNQLNALARHEAWVACLLKHNLSPKLSVNVPYGMQHGYDAAKQLLVTGEHFTAIFAGNDDLALGAIRALSEAGKAIPQDVSIVGFDDAQHAQFLTPSLTTIRLDFRALGKISAKYLIELIEDADADPYQRVLTPELIIRESTSALHT